MSYPEKKILLLTANFPYYPGEQFLEEEIRYWAENIPTRLTILPENASGVPRKIPDNVTLDHSLALKENVIYRRLFYLYVLVSPVFRKEVRYVFQKYRFRQPRCFMIALRTSYRVFTLQRKLKRYLKLHPGKYIVYAYWFDAAAYAAALLKKRNKVHHIICRAHGFDVYENRRPYGYMPLKRQIAYLFDNILAISNEGKNYLCNTYEINENKVCIARLGVETNNVLNIPNGDNELTIISISYCVAVKRIDKIILAISGLANEESNLKIVWHHLGDGPELMKLRELAERSFNAKNIYWQFHGELSNKAVKQFLATTHIDVFINVSESEGVPVSIMEAMSVGIPAIAPDIGGVGELVNRDNGIILTPSPEIDTIVAALRKMQFFKNINIRNNAKSHIEKYFNSKRNYQKLVSYFQSIH